jgi:XTP/dITP diphosphohydrolase
MDTLILATRNGGKIRELVALLRDLPVTIVSLNERAGIPEVVEDGTTFQENALKKAREIFRATGIPSLADDSGLEVDVLGMRPGVYSARYAGENVSYEANNVKLLAELAGVPAEKRGAQFRSVVAFVAPGREELTEGICRGTIATAPRGENGFGYDPLFIPDGYQLTFAELTLDLKNSISHRALALRRMTEIIKSYYNQK